MYPHSILKNAGSKTTPETDFLHRAQNAAINKSKMQPRSILKNAGCSSVMTTPHAGFLDHAQNELPTCATIDNFLENKTPITTPDVLDQFQIKQKQARELELALQNFGGMDINMRKNSKSVSSKRMSHEEAQLLRALGKLKRCTERRQQKEIRRGMWSMSLEAREEGKGKVVVDELEEFLCEERRRGREMRFAEVTDDEMGDVHMSG